jgi:hypothetical protein
VIKKIVSAEPFPHIIIDDFLSQELLKSLIESTDVLPKYFHHKANKGKRLAVVFGSKSYRKLIKEQRMFSKLHSNIIDEVFLSEVYDAFADKFDKFGLKKEYQNLKKSPLKASKSEFFVSENILKRIFVKLVYNPIIRGKQIRIYLRKLEAMLFGTYLYPSISISRSTGGYQEPAHVDARHKVFVGLIYLDDMVDEGELFLYNNTNHSIYDSPMYPDNEELTLFQTVYPKKNRLVLFLNSNNAYHGTGSFSGERKFIYFSFAAAGVESAFESKFSTLLGDRNKEEDARSNQKIPGKI